MALNHGMTESDKAPVSPTGMPHIPGHRHSDVSGGWLRAATFGAMDGLVSNTALIAGVAAAASANTVVLSGVAGLLAGAFSMALGEYTSVTTANEQIDSEVRLERRALRTHLGAEKTELVWMLVEMGMSPDTAEKASEEIHRDEERALNVHVAQELGVDPREKPSPWVAAGSSFVMFAIGAIIPLIPYLLGFESLWVGVLCGGLGLLIAGGVAARFTSRPIWFASLRQLAFGMVAIAATYLVGSHGRYGSLVFVFRRIGLVCALALSACGIADTTATGRPTAEAPKYLGQVRVEADTTVDGTVVGGLSGLSYDPGSRLYYIVSDDRSARNPARFYTARIALSDNGIDGVEFVSTRPWLD